MHINTLFLNNKKLKNTYEFYFIFIFNRKQNQCIIVFQEVIFVVLLNKYKFRRGQT